MIHSFETVLHNNGNLSVTFMQNSKKRSIIFQRGTEAYNDYYDLISTDKNSVKERIEALRTKYFFKANVNNKSIFRPIHKSLILNS